MTGDAINSFNAVENRTRRLAGNSNAWVVKTAGAKDDAQMGLRYGLIDPEDMTERSWVAGSGWPIGFAELEPWFHRAHEHFAIGEDDYDPSASAAGDALGEDFWGDHLRALPINAPPINAPPIQRCKRLGRGVELRSGVRSNRERSAVAGL